MTAALARRPGRREAGTERELGVATALVGRVELTAQLVRVLPDRVQLGRGLQLGMHVLRVGADTSESNFEFECAARVDAWNARQRGVATVHVAAVAVGWRRPCGRALYWRAAGLYRDERRSASSIPAAPPATPAKT